MLISTRVSACLHAVGLLALVWGQPIGCDQPPHVRRDHVLHSARLFAAQVKDRLLAEIELDYKPVVQTRYEPMERKY